MRCEHEPVLSNDSYATQTAPALNKKSSIPLSLTGWKRSQRLTLKDLEEKLPEGSTN